ncbi:MAG: hypothetical protein P1U88_22010 [Thalassobaculaceae bacterium]|nr:hypothetical protein [Thalassobaculaceae bacterium]
MLDPATYDLQEEAAKARCGDWTTIASMTPTVFNESGFPVRIKSLSALSYLITTMDETDCSPMLNEIGGARPADIAAIGAATQRYLRFHRILFGARPAIVPVSRLLYTYLIFRKIKALSDPGAILEIGAADGYLPLFIATDDSFKTYDQMEVTQSYYVFQSLIGSHVWGTAHLDLAKDDARYAGPIVRGWDNPRSKKGARLALEIHSDVRSTLFPWWRFNEAFDRRYNLIMSNENICEISLEAFIYYAEQIACSLTPNGMFFVHGIGRTREKSDLDKRLVILRDVGLRPTLLETTQANGGPLHTPNLMFIGPRHPDHGTWSGNFTGRRFNTDDPAIRRAYGLDEPAGHITGHDQFVAALREYLNEAA